MPSGRAMEQRAWFARGVVVQDGAMVKIADLNFFFLNGGFRPRAPRHGRPHRCGNSVALAIPGPTVVNCMLIVGLIVFDCGCKAF